MYIYWTRNLATSDMDAGERFNCFGSTRLAPFGDVLLQWRRWPSYVRPAGVSRDASCALRELVSRNLQTVAVLFLGEHENGTVVGE